MSRGNGTAHTCRTVIFWGLKSKSQYLQDYLLFIFATLFRICQSKVLNCTIWKNELTPAILKCIFFVVS